MVNRINILLLFFLSSCLPKTDCESVKVYYKEQECIAIVKELPVYADNFLSNGINPYTGKECNCVEKDRWWRNYIDEIEIGDTIIKRKGELTFNIHKKDTIITHYLKCNDKIYK